MKTNNEILEIVFEKYKLKSLIKKIIHESYQDDSYKDLEQIIYVQLLVMNNDKLNGLFERNELRKWISQIIKNQRNYYKNEYQRCRYIDNFQVSEGMVIKHEHNYMLDWLDHILNIWNWDKKMTKEEIYKAGCFEILKFYLSSGYSMMKISKQFGCSNTKINTMIIDAKKEIYILYEKTYDVWYEKNVGIEC